MTGPYQPPSSQPGEGGWPGGDINSPFGFTDPTSPVGSGDAKPPSEADEPSPYEGVQYSLETPGGSPSTPPPYQYAPAPVTAVPMHGPMGPPGPPVSGGPMPPQGYPGAQPGYGPPKQAYGPPIPTPQRGGNTGWIVGGIVGVVVILLVVAGIVVIASLGGGDEGEGGGSSGTYAFQEGLCGRVDMAKLTAQDSTLGGMTETAYTDSLSCDASGEYGSLYVTADFFDDATAAQDDYSSSKSIWLDPASTSNVRDHTGSWDEGSVGDGSSLDTGDFSVTMLVRADNLVVLVSFYAFGTSGGSQDGAIEASTDLVNQLLTMSKAA
ncbi:hypothetical protein LX16_5126 [Stackebrandtia albiflava]|uniref:Uncharacterized protein n=1 Tax=Stackebrandtia albiflava TaxID=406432 RepID=A0A562UPU9_9ACTN|nr:hypothetical protein [Stackebrandtia albiflava]TWJ07640.1 hypothetical protein LX16_5126 [Stackebrandtia albiflava]